MRMHSTIAVAAMAVALAAPQAAMAKTVKHAKVAKTTEKGLTTAEQLQMAQQQLAQMQAQLNALQAKIDQQQSQQASASDVQAASAKADQALAAASAAKTAAADASAKAAKPAIPEAVKWAADTKISGRMYFNASTVSVKDGAGNSLRKDGAFELKRFYVGIDHKFNDTFSGNITTDVTAPSGQGATLYVKKAYLQAKINKALVVKLGAADMPWIPYVEGVNGYRHIEKTITDLDGFGTSSDWGMHVSGDLADGLVSYQVSAVNGAGYKDIHATKSVDFEGRLSVKYKGFDVAVGGYTGKLGNNTQTNVNAGVFYRNATRFDALVAYKGNIQNVGFSVGGEYFFAKNWKVKTTSPEDATAGYSVFASVSPVKQWSVFGRYDWVQQKRDTVADSSLRPTDHFYNVGIQYSPAKIVDLALVYKRDKGDNAVAIGNLNQGVTRDEIGLYGQFRF